MRYVVSTFSLVLLASLCFSQRAADTSNLLPHPVYQNGTAVYINRSGTVVFKSPFSNGSTFSEGLAAFTENDKVGFMDETGKVAIKPSFDSAKEFSEGYAAIEVNDKWGFIDKTGRHVINPQFDTAESFSEGLARVEMYVGDARDGDDIYKSGFIDKKGTMVIGRTRKPVMIGKRIFTSPKFDEAGDFSESLAPVRVGAKWGYVNKEGQFAIQLQFKGAKMFSDGLAPVTYDGLKWGYLNKAGKLVIQPQFADAGSFSEGFAPIAVYRSGYAKEWGFIDSEAHIVIAPQFYGAEEFHEGLASIFEPKRGGFGFIDTAGREIIKPQFDGVGRFVGGIAWVSTPKDKGGYIDTTGGYIWKPEER